MGIVSSSQQVPVERRSSTLFLLSGCLLLGHAGVLGLQAFSNLRTPPDLFGPTGHFVALVGLLALYPVVVDRSPILARAAGSVATVALASWGAMTGTRLLAVVGAAGTDLLPGAVVGLMFATTVLTYILFGLATTRVAAWPGRVGLLVVAPAVLLLMVLVASPFIDVAGRAGFVISIGLALVMMAVGYTLRTGAAEPGQVKETADMPVG